MRCDNNWVGQLPCQAPEGCEHPSLTWAVFDTPVGSFELELCEHHLDDADAGKSLIGGIGWSGAVGLVLEHPVVHGDPS